jgi:hypothetical protein
MARSREDAGSTNFDVIACDIRAFSLGSERDGAHAGDQNQAYDPQSFHLRTS